MNKTLQLAIKKELNINIKKIQISINNSQNEIQALFEREEYNVKYINFQNNSINGIIEKSSNQYFFKLLNEPEFRNEITGYIKIYNALPVNKIINIYQFLNCFIIIYQYEDSISENEGLLNDFLAKNDLIINNDAIEIIDRIINLYNNIFKTTVYRSNYPMKQFYKNRIPTRLKRWYQEEKLLNYNIIINGVSSKKTTEIIQETINFFETNLKLPCALTQGDPNTLNIGIKPIFFDFATSGYNPIICEFAAIFWSVLIVDAYLGPKYHKKAYNKHENIFKNVQKFSPDLKYDIDNKQKKIHIQSNIKTTIIRKEFIKRYIDMLEHLNIKIGKEIIYFLTMRILCIFDIRAMSKEDYFYSIFILHYLYKDISDNVYDSLRSIIERFDNI